MSVDLSRPHITIIFDEDMGDTALVKEAPDGEVYCLMHPSVAENDSPARFAGHVVLREAIKTAMRNHHNRPSAADVI